MQSRSLIKKINELKAPDLIKFTAKSTAIKTTRAKAGRFVKNVLEATPVEDFIVL